MLQYVDCNTMQWHFEMSMHHEITNLTHKPKNNNGNN